MSNRVGIAIPSRQRLWKLPETLDSFVGTGLPVHFFVERREYSEYRDFLLPRVPDGQVEVHCLPASDAGVGYARRMAAKTMHELDYLYAIFNDDDIALPANTEALVDAMEDEELDGCGSWFRIHKHFIGVEQGTGVHRNPGNMGVRSFAVDMERLAELDFFDEKLRSNYEDYDMLLRMIKDGSCRWGINSDVVAAEKGGRYQNGGIDSVPGDTGSNELDCAKRMADKHPQYVTVTSKGKARVNWRRAYRDECGESYPLEL